MEISKSSKYSNQLKQLIDKEVDKKLKMQHKLKLKYDPTQFTLQNVTTTANIGQLFNPAQGVLETNRVGDFFRLTRLRCNLVVNNTATTGNDCTYVRFIVFVWHFDNSEYAPIATDILINNNYLSNYSFESLRMKKFTVLYDKLYGSSFDWKGSLVDRIDKGLNIKGGFNSTGTTGWNQVFYYLQSNAGAVTIPQVQFDCQIYFEDTQ